jgi:hypothetical protein
MKIFLSGYAKTNKIYDIESTSYLGVEKDEELEKHQDDIAEIFLAYLKKNKLLGKKESYVEAMIDIDKKYKVIDITDILVKEIT